MTEPVSRRTFIGTSAAAAAAFAFPSGVFTQGSSVIRVGLIGCGGRGNGAAQNCVLSSPGVELVAMGDLVPDRLASGRAELAKLAASNAAFARGFKVTDDRAFTGFDAYQKVLQSSIDLVILATPPGFRPAHLAAAVAAGKHIFTEKPVAVDSAGIRSVLATYETAKQKNLAIVAGTQRRHEAKYVETINRIHDGAIGDVMSGQVYWNQGGLWSRTQEAGWTDGEWQIRNWLYFTWLSGDHIVEQHVHNLDVANWALKAHPIRAVGLGGRQSRVEQPRFGHIYDHFAIDYEYPNGARVVSMCRQIAGTPEPDRRVVHRDKGTDRRAQRRDPGRIRVEVQLGRETRGPVRAGTHRPHREHSKGPASQRAQDRGRKHAHGDHGTRGRLHGTGSHVGRGAQGRSGARPARRRVRLAARAAGADAG